MRKIFKKAAIGETMTWVVATFAILFIIFLFLVASGSVDLGGVGKFISSSKIFALKFPEQQESLFAMAENNVIDMSDEEIKEILENLNDLSIPGYEYPHGWNLIINKRTIETYSDILDEGISQNFYVYSKEKNIKLRLYLRSTEDNPYGDRLE